jgi:hypothetical protein
MSKLFSDEIGVNLYCIRNSLGDYWDNNCGWIESGDDEAVSTYSVFTTAEKEAFNLPVDGHWELM